MFVAFMMFEILLCMSLLDLSPCNESAELLLYAFHLIYW